MSLTIVDKKKTLGIGPVRLRKTAATNKKIRVTITGKIIVNSYRNIHACGWKSFRVQFKIALAIILKQTQLHFPAIDHIAVAPGAEQEVEIPVVVAIKQQDGDIFKVDELLKSPFIFL